MEWAHLIGRILLTLPLMFSAMNHFTGGAAMKGYAASKGVPAPGFAVTLSGAILLAGCALVLLGWYPYWGILLVTLFLLPVSFMMHNFWAVPPEQKQTEMINFIKNMSILGGMWALLALPQPWPLSLGG